MAEGEVNKEQGPSVAFGSEIVFDFYCELCRDDGLNVEAEGFCVDCEEYLCKSCIHVHRKSRSTRHHDLLDQDSMPKDTPLSQDRVGKDISTKCNIHSSKTVEYYCTSHDTLGCSTCFVKMHRNCTDIESVYEQSENVLNSQEYSDFMGKLKYLEQTSRDMISKTRDNVTTTEQNCSDAMNEIKKLREEFDAVFNEMEQSLITQVEATRSENRTRMESLENELKEFSNAIESLRSEIENLFKSKRVCQLYIKMKERKGEVSSLERNLRKAEESNDVPGFKFEPNYDIKNVLKTTGLGKIVLPIRQSAETGTVVAEDSLDFKDTTAAHVADIDVSSNFDCKDHFLHGSAVLNDTRLVVADGASRKVKLVDTGVNKLIGELKVPDYPFDVAVINENTAAVSLLGGQKILLLSIRDTLNIDREILVNGECRGVAYNQNKLFVTFSTTPRLDIMDLQGTVIKRIEQNSDGKKLFSTPRHVCVSENGENIYVSDEYLDKVFCLTFDGVVKSVYSGVKKPKQVCTDKHGCVFIGGSNEMTVHIITADCTKGKEVLTQRDGLNNRVLSVSHCQNTNRLYVGMSGSRIIKVYQLHLA